ncbi:Enoyl-(Acyl carrier protein) reductase [Rhizoctonia solani]|uniref:Enoyl-(Acyl carrier protein) reductase n=1 Tax=Rhizoctonia solani TaxID=456999 RepID=A0A8H8NS87_9AGAM|nr:Enoyl-(Acyl carrier protein) reductase [Rhizoctonia solani]QRW19081.1 Enoyl-(Acyl carrier protein) reductase [Rhizoctonia solani]
MASTTEAPLVGVAAALKAASDPSFTPKKTLFNEFSLEGRVAIVTGANRGLGLEMALALCEAGATVYALDLPQSPGEEFTATAEYAKKLGSALKYVSVDVTDQQAAAGILGGADCLVYKADDFQRIMNVNVNGVLYSAQAAGQQMTKYGTPGSIILIASMSGSITNRDHAWVAYNTSKSAVLQMARSMACELGKHKIRVNSISPGHIYTKMTAAFIDTQPELAGKWASMNPLGRLGRPDELRGVVAWLASDASTFCTGSDILVSGGHHAW